MKWLDRYYQTQIWQRKRKERLALDNYQCRLCDEDGTDYRLEVHHRPSSYKKIPNESSADDLITLCSVCHNLITNRIRERRYTNREIQINHIDKRRNYHGVEKQELSIEVGITLDLTQRPTRIPTKSDHNSDEEIIWQEIENGGRFRSTRKT
jgi:hypothetical protein